MSDQGIYKLLIEVDHGRRLTRAQVRLINSVTSIKWDNVNELPKSIRSLKALKKLNLHNAQVSDISVLIGMSSITDLNLSNTKVRDISALRGLTSLVNLNLSRTEVNDIRPLRDLTSLRSINISFTKVNSISALYKLTGLNSLSLSETRVRDISVVRTMPLLTDLNLRMTQVNDISAISELKQLRHLDLCHLKLNSIPESLLDLNLEFISENSDCQQGILINGVTLEEQAIEIFSQDRETIRSYYRYQNNVPINECKVIFLGDTEAGKTLSINRLLHNGEKLLNFNGSFTPGLEISFGLAKLDNKDITVNYWDFGSQEILHAVYRMYMTEHTVFVVYLDAKRDPLDDRVRYWIESINTFAPGAPVLLVINKIDLNDHPKFNEEGLRTAYNGQIKDVVRMSALYDEQDTFVEKLQGGINNIIKELPTVNTMVPQKWKSLILDLRSRDDYYLTKDQFNQICLQYDIKRTGNSYYELLDLLSSLGVGFCYYHNRSVENYILLNPMWLVNAVYTILLNGNLVSNNGIVTQNDLYDLLQSDFIYREAIRKMDPGFQYSGIEVNYIIDVLQMFQLLYLLEDGSLFFPILCDDYEKIPINEVISSSALHYVLRYKYLPLAVMHQLIIDLQSDLDYRFVWKSGAVFRNEALKQIAYINVNGNNLHIYVDSKDSVYHPERYYMIIRHYVEMINNEMGIISSECYSLVLGGVEEYIPSSEVKHYLEEGQYRVFISRKYVNLHSLLSQYTENISFVKQRGLPLPTGQVGYKDISNTCYYVDKTLIIKDIIDTSCAVYLFSRPRRFGKTLMMNMVRTFFERTDSDTSKYFKDKKIWNAGVEYRAHQGKYPTIFLSFSTAHQKTWCEIYQELLFCISEEYKKHQKELMVSNALNNEDKEYFKRIINRDANTVDVQHSIGKLSEMLAHHFNHKVIIIIDEYDTPIQQGYLYGCYNDVVDFMRILFSAALKDNENLQYGLLTGILRIAKDSLFSGLNNVNVNTIMDNDFSEYFGFTQSEVNEMANYYGQLGRLPDLRRWYDGYKFGSTEIFNPWSVVNYFSHNCTLAAYWTRTSGHELINEMIKESSLEILDAMTMLMQGKEIKVFVDMDIIYPEVKGDINMLCSLLLLTGYLQVKEIIDDDSDYITCALSIPNKEIKTVFRREILRELRRIVTPAISRKFKVAFESNNDNQLTEVLREYLMKSASTFDTTHENFYHGTLLGMLAVMSDEFFITSNRESGEGRYDIQLEPMDKNKPGYIIELKAGKDKTSEELDEMAKEAIKQIRNRGYQTMMQQHGIRRFLLYGMSFSGKEAKVVVEHED